MAILDQSQTNAPSGIVGVDTYGFYRSYQTFKSGYSGTVDEIKVYLLKIGTPSDLVVEIRTTSAGQPTSTILATETISESLISDGEHLVSFMSPASVIVGTTYAIVILQDSDGGDSSNYYNLYGDNEGNNYYTDGHSGYGNTTPEWFDDAEGDDAWFQTYMTSGSTQKTITSDAAIATSGVQKTITSDAVILSQTLKDIDNKVNTVKGSLDDINVKINTALRVLSDVYNQVHFSALNLSDINNKINTQKRELYNINNDIRVIKSWQRPGSAGVQSLGKAYITLTIGGVTQTDVDVDSIKISKASGQAFSASFELCRAYDSSKPTLEAQVIIKYNNWELFKGYIVSISPTDTPESIRIECGNKYWLDNRTNTYFHVGHPPTDGKELYYNTPYAAIVAQYSIAPSFGNFTPETLDCFSKGKADTLTLLCEQSGNYSWFYDEDENIRFWVAGAGAIVELDRQIIGTNLKLYDVLEHRFTENADGVINKLRVQMGAKISDQNNLGRIYTGYSYVQQTEYAYPDWSSSYETLVKWGGGQYGWNYPQPGFESEYGEVFKKYTFAGWGVSNDYVLAEERPIEIELSSPGWYYSFNIPTDGLITEGYTLDVEKRTLTFNEPRYCYMKNSYGEITSIRAPLIRLKYWIKKYWTVTLTPADDPESVAGNDLMFITDKVGTYPTTIIKDLTLSNLTIQTGGVVGDKTIPDYDDTDYAEDYALWQLSKTAEKVINGTLTVSLDTVCYYGIDLAKRIFVGGITESNMNVMSLTYNISSFTVDIEVENESAYTRTVSLPYRGE